MNTDEGISLWLVPNPSTTKLIETTMRIKPQKTNPPSSFPSFQPHITLATSPSASALRAALPRDQRAIPVRFHSLAVGEKYFTSVFVVVHSPLGSALETLRAHLRASLGRGSPGSTVPPLAHMSLYYIDEDDRDEREVIARRLRSEGRVLEGGGAGEERFAKLACFDEEGQDPEVIDGFEGEEIWLVNCDGPVPGWEVLDRFPLVG
ncbi:hypothetical protein C8Q74DRAFT_1343620 [Fomes fomentarius]|nr:hypothetical protein C8Q74DRAFT_1343620 [Fomes fomentarius]